MKKKINALLIIGIIGTSVFGAHFGVQYGRAVWGNRDIWWTPMSMALPLEDTSRNFRLFIGGEPLLEHVERGTLTAVDANGQTYSVSSDDIRVRLNNWPEVKADFLHSAIFSGILLGISLSCLILGLAELIRSRKRA
jgi:hypothetical protein